MRAACKLWLVVLPGLLCAGCLSIQPRLMQGDANGAQVEYAGDLAAATAIAEHHCARFERHARYSETAQNLAYFDCVRR